MALVAFFVTGWLCSARATTGATAAAAIAATTVPYVLLVASTFASPGCWVPVGSVLFAAFVPTAAAFGAALAYAITGFIPRFRRTAFVVVGILVTAGSAILDLKFHPQFYTYGHTYGGLLGPVYDANLAIRPGVFTFRIVTFLWVVVLWAAGRAGRSRSGLLVGVLALAALFAAYSFRGTLGFNTTYAELEQELSATHQTEHFEIHYDPDAPLPIPIQQIASEQEYQYHRLQRILGSAPSERIVVFLYGSAESKARLTGSRNTSVAPVWLSVPQVHVLADRYESTIGHELVHVFAREFGSPLVNASYSVSLVEGLAVALEPPEFWIGADDQVRVAARAFDWSESDIARRVTRASSPVGFWTDRGAVAYAMAGSFVGFLLDEFGSEPFKRVYQTGDYEEQYGVGVDGLAPAWASTLMADTSAVEFAKVALVSRQFSRASLFERPCPHVPVEVDSTSTWRAVLRRADSTAMAGDLEHAEVLYDSLAAAVDGGLIERASTVELHRALAVDTLALHDNPLVEWRRLVDRARGASAAGSWKGAADLWSAAIDVLARPGMEPYRYAAARADFERREALWISTNPP